MSRAAMPIDIVHITLRLEAGREIINDYANRIESELNKQEEAAEGEVDVQPARILAEHLNWVLGAMERDAIDLCRRVQGLERLQ